MLFRTREASRYTHEVLGRAGFHLVKYVSNDDRILERVPEDDRMSGKSNMMFYECNALVVSGAFQVINFTSTRTLMMHRSFRKGTC